MKLYQLIWELLKHALRGRIRDEVFVAIRWSTPTREGAATGPVVGFTRESRAEAFCLIESETDEEPYSDTGPSDYWPTGGAS